MKKKILILSNEPNSTYIFRKEIIEMLLNNKYEVFLSVSNGEKVNFFLDMGVKILNSDVDRRGKNPFKDLNLYRQYKKIMKELKPDIVLTYTIKPNIYGGLAAKKLKIPYIANITGLGTAVENKGLLQRITTFLYKKAFKNIDVVFFQNEENQNFFETRKMSNSKHVLIPGSGVNLNLFKYNKMKNDDIVKFIFVSRIMKEKGIEYYIDAARHFKEKYKEKVEFHVLGSMEENYKDFIRKLHDENIIKYHGRVSNVNDYLKEIHCIIHPTYYPEGMSNVLLEAASIGRAIITTNRNGTREIVEEGKNGYIVEIKNQNQLNDKIEKFIGLSFAEKEAMGLYARKKVEKEFDRNLVVEAYLKEINKILNKGGQ